MAVWRRLNRAALAVLLAAHVVGLGLAVNQCLFYLAQRDRLFMLDFGAYYVAAAVLNSPTPSLYDDQLAATLAPRLGLPAPPPPYIYPPFFAVITRPLAWLPYYDAVAVWTALNLAALGLALALLLWSLGQWRGGRRLARVLGGALTLPLVYTNLVLVGQSNLLVLALIAAAYAFGRLDQSPRRQALAGLALGLAVGVKLFAAVLIPYYLLSRRPRVALWGLLGYGLTEAVGLVGGGWNNVVTYYTRVLPSLTNEDQTARIHNATAWYNYNIGATVERLVHPSEAVYRYYFSPGPVHAVIPPALPLPPTLDPAALGYLAGQTTKVVFVGLTLLVLAVNWRWRRRGLTPPVDLGLGLLLVATTLLIPLAWQATHVVDLLAASLLLAPVYTPRARQANISLLLLVAALLLVNNYWSLLYVVWGSVSPWLLTLGGLGVLLVWGRLAWLILTGSHLKS